MKNRGFTIRQKILVGFFSLIVVFAGYGFYNIITLNKSGKIIEASKEVIDPSLDAIKDLKLMIAESEKFTYEWIYAPLGAKPVLDDQQELRDIHSTRYPLLKSNLQKLMKNWQDSLQVARMDSIFNSFEEYLKIQKSQVMDVIMTDIEKQNDRKFEMDQLVEDQIAPKAKALTRELEQIENEKRKEKTTLQTELLASFESLTFQIIVLIIVLSILGALVAIGLTGNIITPINYINKVISQLGRGELPEERKIRFRRDEIGQIATSVDKLIQGLRSTSLFAENIGRGNYNAEFQPLSSNDVLGNALINMRNNLAKVAEEDRRRSWATEGLAQFGEILRKNNDDIKHLADVIISNLVKYVKANQGGLFIVTKEDEEDEPYLNMEACYAWDKKKYLEQKVYLGDGLTGQAWQEQGTIYLTEVPNDYVMITSGLGEANPNSILIVPLKVNDEVFGVVELASFNHFELYEIEFVERIAESIASTISTVKNNEQTQRLLEESKMLTEQMRAQEEEMRQNMEELQATQEEMEKSQVLSMEKEAIFDANTIILETNKKFNITSANAMASQVLYYSPEEFEGMPISKLFYSENKFEELKLNLSRGETWSSIVTVKGKNNEEILVKISAGVVAAERIGGVGRYIIILDNINEINLLQN